MNDRYPLALSEGTVLSGQFVIHKILGQGGFGITYEAQDYKTGYKVAIKEFFPDSLATRNQGQTKVVPFTGDRGDNFEYGKECFLQEAKTLAQFIGNENIVRIHSYFEENGTAYFVMDFIEGTSLDEYIKKKGGRLNFKETTEILLPVVDALRSVHEKGLVHRDVAPDNIYITFDGKIKLIDFGAARQSLGDKSQSLDVVLKHGFAPKEQYSRRGRQGPYTDIYALGATFYFALTGIRPPDSIDRLDEESLVPPSRLGVELPAEAEAAIIKSLNVKAEDRFQSMDDFKKSFLSGSQNETGDATPAELKNSAETSTPHWLDSDKGKKSEKKRTEHKKSHAKEIIFAVMLIIALIIVGVIIIVSNISMSSASASNYENIASTETEEASTEPATEGTDFELLFSEASEKEEQSEPETENVNESRELFPEIDGNLVGNLINESEDYDRLGNRVVSDDGGVFFSVSMVEGYIYAINDNDMRAVRQKKGSSVWEDMPVLDNCGNIHTLLVSKDYYYFVDAETVLHCVSRENGYEIGNKQLDRDGSYTFTNEGKMYYIDGDSGKQFISAVPAGKIDDKQPEKVTDLPEDITWKNLTYDGNEYYLFGQERYGKSFFYLVNADSLWSTELKNLKSMQINADDGILYYLYFLESGETAVGFINEKKQKTGELWTDTASKVLGLAICEDGNISFTVDKEIKKISTEEAK